MTYLHYISVESSSVYTLPPTFAYDMQIYPKIEANDLKHTYV